MATQHRPAAFVTGASRGIGAGTAIELGRNGWDVAIGAREKGKRADRVADEVRLADPDADTQVLLGDLTDIDVRERVVNDLAKWRPRLGALVLNAAAGLEKGKPSDYALNVNCLSQIALADALLPSLADGGTIVYVTSHWSHLYERDVQMPPYDYHAVASTKSQGEANLTSMIPKFSANGTRLIVVTAGIVTGTFVGDRAMKEYPDFGKEQTALSNVTPLAEMAAGIVRVIQDQSLPTGHIQVLGAALDTMPRVLA